MISNFREEGGRFSKLGESLCKKAFSIEEKSEIGGRGVKNDSKKSDIIHGQPLYTLIALNDIVLSSKDPTDKRNFQKRTGIHPLF